MLEGNLD